MGVYSRVFRVPAAEQQRAHRVADSKALHVGPDNRDGPRNLETQCRGCSRRQRIASLPLKDVRIVVSRGGDSNKNLARFRRRRLYGNQFQRPSRTDPALDRDRAHALGYGRRLRHQRKILFVESIFNGRES